MKIIKFVYKLVDKLCYFLITLGFSGIVLILGIQMILRIIGTPFMWAEEVSRYLFIWLLFIGCAKAFSKGGHLAVDFLFAKFPKKIQLMLTFIFYIAVIGEYSGAAEPPMLNLGVIYPMKGKYLFVRRHEVVNEQNIFISF